MLKRFLNYDKKDIIFSIQSERVECLQMLSLRLTFRAHGKLIDIRSDRKSHAELPEEIRSALHKTCRIGKSTSKV